MKKLLFALLLLPVLTNAQIITTIAGYHIYTYSAGYSGDGGPATAAELSAPQRVRHDGSGNIFIADAGNSRIRKVNAAGIITTVAGTGFPIHYGDGGPATAAGILDPKSVDIDKFGNIYIAEGDGGISAPHCIRKVDTLGIITTIAGNGTTVYSGDGGPATAAGFAYIRDIALDKTGNIYITDGDSYRIRKIDAAGIITTVAGNGTLGVSGDGGPATAAQLFNPFGIALDTFGNLYITDLAHRIRKVNTSGIITTIAGNGSPGHSGDGGPATAAELEAPESVTVDVMGNVYITQALYVRKIDTAGIISTITGNGTIGYSGDGGPATAAVVTYARGVSADAAGNIYISDQIANTVRKICAHCSSLSVQNSSKSAGQFGLSPNPASSELTITSTDNITNITISNIAGQTVYAHAYNTHKVQVGVADLPTGVYFVKINGTETREFLKR